MSKTSLLNWLKKLILVASHTSSCKVDIVKVLLSDHSSPLLGTEM